MSTKSDDQQAKVELDKQERAAVVVETIAERIKNGEPDPARDFDLSDITAVIKLTLEKVEESSRELRRAATPPGGTRMATDK